jgi:hypothetical protein
MRRLLLSTLALAGGFAGAAHADTYTGHTIRTPSHLVFCQEVQFKPFGLNCFARYLTRPTDIPEGDPYILLRRHRGKAQLRARSDSAGYPGKPHTLQYGDTWKTDGITCHLKETGLTCRNTSHHGFHLAKGDVRLF